jgi:hypothetical protein
MSYARWTRDCDWYIYWQSSKAQRPEDEVLAVWHVTACPGEPNTEFRYSEVTEMLAQNDFSRIRGWSPSASGLLRDAFSSFVRSIATARRGSSPLGSPDTQ